MREVGRSWAIRRDGETYSATFFRGFDSDGEPITERLVVRHNSPTSAYIPVEWDDLPDDVLFAFELRTRKS